jgi:MoxR-like ATPase
MPRKVYSFSQFLGENYYIKEDKMSLGKIGGMMKKVASSVTDWASNLKKAIRDKVFGVITSGPKSGTSPVKVYLPEDGDIVSQIKKAYAGTQFGSMNIISSQELQKISESSEYDFGDQHLYESTKSDLSAAGHTEIKGVRDVGTDELFMLLKESFEDILDGIPVKKPYFIFGAPGIGKTMIVGEIAQKFKVPLIDLDVSLRNLEDLAGVPTPKDVSPEIMRGKIAELESQLADLESKDPDSPEIPKIKGKIIQMKEVGEGVTRDNPPYFLPRVSGKGGIIFLDEANRPITSGVYNVIAQFLQDKRIGTYKLPEKWMIVAAGNRPKEANVEPFDSSFARRIIPLNFVPSPERWQSYSLKKGFPEAIVNVIANDPELFHFLELGDDSNMEYPNPANWETAFDELLRKIKRRGLRDWTDLKEDDLRNLFQDHVGPEAANKIVEYLSIFKLLTREDIEKILNKPEEAKLVDFSKTGKDSTSVILGLSGFLSKILADEHSTQKKKDGKTYYEANDLQKVGNLYDYLARYKKPEILAAVYSSLGKMWPMFSWTDNYLIDEPYEVVLEEFENGTRDEKDPLVQAAKIAKEYVDKVMSSARRHKAGEV